MGKSGKSALYLCYCALRYGNAVDFNLFIFKSLRSFSGFFQR